MARDEDRGVEDRERWGGRGEELIDAKKRRSQREGKEKV